MPCLHAFRCTRFVRGMVVAPIIFCLPCDRLPSFSRDGRRQSRDGRRQLRRASTTHAHGWVLNPRGSPDRVGPSPPVRSRIELNLERVCSVFWFWANPPRARGVAYGRSSCRLPTNCRRVFGTGYITLPFRSRLPIYITAVVTKEYPRRETCKRQKDNRMQ